MSYIYINSTQFVIVGATLAEGAELSTILRWCPKLHRLRSDVAHRVSQAVDVSFHQVHDSNKFKEMVQCLHQYTEELGKNNLKVGVLYIYQLDTVCYRGCNAR